MRELIVFASFLLEGRAAEEESLEDVLDHFQKILTLGPPSLPPIPPTIHAHLTNHHLTPSAALGHPKPTSASFS